VVFGTVQAADGKTRPQPTPNKSHPAGARERRAPLMAAALGVSCWSLLTKP